LSEMRFTVSSKNVFQPGLSIVRTFQNEQSETPAH
jgi:hypothetical protein